MVFSTARWSSAHRPLLAHPSQPALEVLPVEVVEADVGALDMIVIGQVVKEALQADPVGLDRLR
jgi:hypothetical protein